MKRLVLDPNALASGIVDPQSDRPPRLLFDALENLAFEVVICPKLLAELRKALRKPYFRDKLSAEEARKAVKRLEVVAVALEDPAGIEPTLRDPQDDYHRVRRIRSGPHGVADLLGVSHETSLQLSRRPDPDGLAWTKPPLRARLDPRLAGGVESLGGRA